MIDCIFCKIVKKDVPSEILRENEDAVIFKDIRPSAPIHYLIVPKKHIQSVDHLEIGDKELMGELILAARKIAKEKNISLFLPFDTSKIGEIKLGISTVTTQIQEAQNLFRWVFWQ